MKDGTYHYSLEMTTPLGKRRGNLELVIRDQNVDGKLTMFTRTLPIQSGCCAADHISFAGDMKTLTERIPYTAEGTVNGSRIDILFATRQGNYPAVGRQQIAEQRKETAP